MLEVNIVFAENWLAASLLDLMATVISLYIKVDFYSSLVYQIRHTNLEPNYQNGLTSFSNFSGNVKDERLLKHGWVEKSGVNCSH